MIVNDGGRPSNVDRGYILRRLLRRMTRHMNKLGIDLNTLPNIIDISINSILELYPELEKNRNTIKQIIIEEKDKFMKTLQKGEKEFEKVARRAKENNQTIISAETVYN